MPANVALIQLVSGADTARNLRDAGALLERVHDAGAALAVLPENFAFMGRDDAARVGKAETPGDGPIQEFLSATASRLGLTIVGGTVPLATTDPTRPRSACLVFDPAGRQIARYDKIHLFDVALPGGAERYRESASTSPGDEIVVVDTSVGRVGLAVCYDLRFPELFRLLQERGADLIAVPSAFTATTGAAHWEVLVRARAVENLTMVIAAGQGGRHDGGRVTHGHSMIVDAWGGVLDVLPHGAGTIVTAFDRDAQQRMRTEFGALAARRLSATNGHAEPV